MATRIKAVKCPQCGSEKHEQLDEKRYRCLNCGTEFFLDDDDINVNVNHHYDFQSSNFLNNDLSTGIKLAIGAVVVPLIVVFVIAISLRLQVVEAHRIAALQRLFATCIPSFRR